MSSTKTESQPRVSIVTANKNYSRYLKDSIEDVLGQDYPNWELILVDYGSNDDSFKILKKYSRHPKIHINIINANHQTEAFIYGFNRANGKYLVMKGSDDQWHTNYLAKVVEEIESDPKLGLVFTNAQIINDKYELIHESFIDYHHRSIKLDSSQQIYRNLLKHNFIPTSSALFTYESYHKVGGLVNTPYCEDLNLWIKIGNFYKIKYLPQSLIRYSLHPDSAIQTKWAKRISSLIKVYTDTPRIKDHLERQKYKKISQLRLELAYIQLKKCNPLFLINITKGLWYFFRYLSI